MSECMCIDGVIVTLDSDNQQRRRDARRQRVSKQTPCVVRLRCLTHCVALSRQRMQDNSAQLSAAMLCVLWADIRGCRPAVNYCWLTTSRRHGQSHTSSRYAEYSAAWKTWAGVRMDISRTLRTPVPTYSLLQDQVQYPAKHVGPMLSRLTVELQ